MPLSTVAIDKAKARAKLFKLFDGGGLFLLISPNGAKWWRFKYRFASKEKQISFGVYPDVGLKDARERRDVARKQVAAGIDPSEHRKAAKAANAEKLGNTFEVVAREWIAKQQKVWAEQTYIKKSRLLERDIYPRLGRRPIADVTAQELLKALQRIEDRGSLEMAHSALETCSQVLRYGIVTGRATYDISRDLRGALQPAEEGHYAAFTNPEDVGGLIRAIRGYKGEPVTRYALQLAPLVFIRPGELRKAEWAEFNLETADWIIPGAKMKREKVKIKELRDHHVPLSTQAVAILKELYALTGRGRYVFPNERSSKRPMSDNAVLAALRRMGFTKEEMTGHGFRAMARTILEEVLDVPPHLIEHQLAHKVKDANGRAYNRTRHLKKRRMMMQTWADYLDKLATTLPGQ